MSKGKDNDVLIGPDAEELIGSCESIEYNVEEMFPASIMDQIKIMACQMSVPPLYLSFGLLSVVSTLLGNAKIKISPTWSEPLLLWTIILGMKSSGKSPVYGKIVDALVEVEEKVIDEAKIEHQNTQNVDEQPAKKLKTSFKSAAYQMICTGSTFEGLQDVLKSKESIGKPASLLYASDELATFFANIQNNPNFENNVLSWYTAKMLRLNTRQHGETLIKKPLVNIMGFTQHETYLKEISKKVDTGGLLERMILAAPEKTTKNREIERRYEDVETVDFVEVLNIY